MLQLAGRNGEHAALHFDRGHILGFEFLDHKIVRAPGINFGATRIDIDRGVIVFGPGVDGEMRFGDDDDTGDAMRIKRVEDSIDDSGPGMFGGVHHDRFDFMHVVQHFGVAIIKFDQQVPAK